MGSGGSSRHPRPSDPAIRGVKPWEVYSWQAPGWPEPHPAVIISEGSRVANKPEVNVLLCSTKEATRAPGPTEDILDKSDGIDWASLCKCDLTYSVEKAQLCTTGHAPTLGWNGALLTARLQKDGATSTDLR